MFKKITFWKYDFSISLRKTGHQLWPIFCSVSHSSGLNEDEPHLSARETIMQRQNKRVVTFVYTLVLPFTTINPFQHNDTFWRISERSLLKTLWEKEKLLVQAISPFPTMFSTISKTEIIIFLTFSLSSANAFNLVWSKILCCRECRARSACTYVQSDLALPIFSAALSLIL